MAPTLVEKLVAVRGDQSFVIATSKRDVLAALDRLREVVQGMDDFTEFPEGAGGAILFALLKAASDTCPDPGDFNSFHQGYQAALHAAFTVLSTDIDWFPGR